MAEYGKDLETHITDALVRSIFHEFMIIAIIFIVIIISIEIGDGNIDNNEDTCSDDDGDSG